MGSRIDFLQWRVQSQGSPVGFVSGEAALWQFRFEIFRFPPLILPVLRPCRITVRGCLM
jgi:hypothetical protein